MSEREPGNWMVQPAVPINTDFWQQIPQSLLDEVCQCPRRFHVHNWEYFSEFNMSYHTGENKYYENGIPICDKPSLFSAVAKCDICEVAYIPKNKYWRVDESEILCPECERKYM